MKINTALILCAGFGKRLNPNTIKKPKPLLQINNITMLERSINLIEKLGINKIIINTFYLKEQFSDFIKNKKFNLGIHIVEDGKNILDTGGGILNMVNHSDENDFFVFNPDTIWSSNYQNEILEMENKFFNSNSKNILLVVNKDKSFDQNLIGDFNLEVNKLNKTKPLNFIYTGCQILEKKIFKKFNNKSFPMSEVWNDLLSRNELTGFESKVNFQHVTNYDIYNKLLKSN